MLCLQLLEALDMPQHKEAVWHFFTTQVVSVIHRYQLMNDWGQEGGSEGEGTMTANRFEEHLLKAVADEPPCVVSVLFTMPACLSVTNVLSHS